MSSSALRRLGRPLALRSRGDRAADVLAWRRRLFAGGTDGNERLTALTGLLLFVLPRRLG